MKKFKRWLIGLAIIALPTTGYIAPQYVSLVPIAKDILQYLVCDNSTSVVR